MKSQCGKERGESRFAPASDIKVAFATLSLQGTGESISRDTPPLRRRLLLCRLWYFDVYLDSSAQRIKVSNHNQRVMRWSLIEICHKKGSKNVLADTLSRALK